jgi:dynein heavy chain
MKMKEILDHWIKVQVAWIYLQPIFYSEDLKRQMKDEGKMFEAVDSYWYVNKSYLVKY